MNDLPRPWEVAGTSEPLLPDDHPLMQGMNEVMKPRDPSRALPSFIDITGPDSISVALFKHNKYCRDDWEMYGGAGPRGMGPLGDGCVCSLDPEAPMDLGGPVTVAMAFEDVAPETLAIMQGYPSNTPVDRLNMPRLWDVEPEGVVHVAGACVVLFGRYMRQRCDWCGLILLEYDLQRVAAPDGQDPTPANWEPGILVRVDGNVSAAIDNPQIVDGQIQLPPDSCAYDPKTQIP